LLNLLKPRKPNYYCLNYEKSIVLALLFVEYSIAQTKDELALKEIYKFLTNANVILGWSICPIRLVLDYLFN
jgi:hypothetical protein